MGQVLGNQPGHERPALVGEDGEGSPAVLAADLSRDQSLVLESVHRPGEPAGGEARLGGQLAHPELVAGAPSQPDEHVHGLAGEGSLLLELTAEQASEAGRGLEEEADSGEAPVVRPLGCGHAPMVPARLRRLVATGIKLRWQLFVHARSWVTGHPAPGKDENRLVRPAGQAQRRHEMSDTTTTTEAVTSRVIDGVEHPAVGSYVLDPMHTSVGFAVRHMAVSKVRGAFKNVRGHA